MKKENELALIIAFYISKYDKQGIRNLGYSTFNEAYRDIEEKIGVKATSVKNRRDEFDPIHDNERVGWYQRPMSPSRVKIVEQFSSMTEPTLRGIVLDILKRDESLSEIISESLRRVSENLSKKKAKFILRGPTGKKAEELFIEEFNCGRISFGSQLKDCRELGVGYDFMITNDKSETRYAEVKGLDGYTGGVVLTDKEWRIAGEKGENYFLVIVSGVTGKPKFRYFKNPAQLFMPKRNISTTITVSWNIPQKQIFD